MQSKISNLESQIQLKVCGLTKLDQIQELVAMDVDFLGFIFYEKSPRFVLNHLSLEQISEINSQGKVGVFVNGTIENILEATEKVKLNYIQLHGDEDENFVLELRQKLSNKIKIIKVIRVGNDILEIKKKLAKISNLKSQISNLLFDTDSKAFGGTGKSFDWSILNELEIPLPYFLSGGISEENIQQLTSLKQKPIALDINSKFEIEAGNKDIEKIKSFKYKMNSNLKYIIKKASEISDEDIKTILNLWEIEAWKNMSSQDFKTYFQDTEFQFLLNEQNEILALLRLNPNFVLEIDHEKFQFTEMVGLVAAVKGQSYGSVLLQRFAQNAKENNRQIISFCEAPLRNFYRRNNIEILKNKAKFIQEFDDGTWQTSEDDDILIINLNPENKNSLAQLNENNIASFYS
ncbi:phosphoribosylanthranilate isomerase [Soonwooa sp.]|uniref:phosphoribosylanthranilate isomerase n=1 Tax=Soonwooa sp. TaxID=1938592 RepID=UPI00341AC0C7